MSLYRGTLNKATAPRCAEALVNMIVYHGRTWQSAKRTVTTVTAVATVLESVLHEHARGAVLESTVLTLHKSEPRGGLPIITALLQARSSLGAASTHRMQPGSLISLHCYPGSRSLSFICKLSRQSMHLQTQPSSPEWMDCTAARAPSHQRHPEGTSVINVCCSFVSS